MKELNKIKDLLKKAKRHLKRIKKLSIRRNSFLQIEEKDLNSLSQVLQEEVRRILSLKQEYSKEEEGNKEITNYLKTVLLHQKNLFSISEEIKDITKIIKITKEIQDILLAAISEIEEIEKIIHEIDKISNSHITNLITEFKNMLLAYKNSNERFLSNKIPIELQEEEEIRKKIVDQIQSLKTERDHKKILQLIESELKSEISIFEAILVHEEMKQKLEQMMQTSNDFVNQIEDHGYSKASVKMKAPAFATLALAVLGAISSVSPAKAGNLPLPKSFEQVTYVHKDIYGNEPSIKIGEHWMDQNFWATKYNVPGAGSSNDEIWGVVSEMEKKCDIISLGKYGLAAPIAGMIMSIRNSDGYGEIEYQLNNLALLNEKLIKYYEPNERAKVYSAIASLFLEGVYSRKIKDGMPNVDLSDKAFEKTENGFNVNFTGKLMQKARDGRPLVNLDKYDHNWKLTVKFTALAASANYSGDGRIALDSLKSKNKKVYDDHILDFANACEDAGQYHGAYDLYLEYLLENKMLRQDLLVKMASCAFNIAYDRNKGFVADYTGPSFSKTAADSLIMFAANLHAENFTAADENAKGLNNFNSHVAQGIMTGLRYGRWAIEFSHLTRDFTGHVRVSSPPPQYLPNLKKYLENVWAISAKLNGENMTRYDIQVCDNNWHIMPVLTDMLPRIRGPPYPEFVELFEKAAKDERVKKDRKVFADVTNCLWRYYKSINDIQNMEKQIIVFNEVYPKN